MLDRTTSDDRSISAQQGGLRRKSPAVDAVIDFSKRKPLGAVGGIVFLVLVVCALLAPVISPYEPTETHSRDVYAAPSQTYPLGTDQVGRDILSRLFWGARISLYVGIVSVAIGISLGSLLGVTSAYFGGVLDLLIQRVVDAFIAFPAIILGLAIMAVLGSSLNNVIIALVIVLTPGAVRTLRSQALAIKEMDYILAARAVGCSDWRIILRHMAPNCFAMFIILVTITVGFAIIVESSLSFLGVGVPRDVATWGSMLSEGAQTYLDITPWLAVFPGLAIAITVFSANLVGDALRDVLDPKLRGR